MPSKRLLFRLLMLFVILWLLTLAIALVLGLGLRHTSQAKSAQEKDDQGDQKTRSKWSNYNILVVATDNELCSTIGRDILTYRGGSTMDAAIAAMICLGMVNPQHCGIGGGFNAVIYDRSKNDSVKVFKSLNARETVPPSVNVSFFEDNPAKAATGPLSILIPGEINGYYEAWKMYGRVPWNDLFQPTVRLGLEGWNVTTSMAVSIMTSINEIRRDPGLSELLLKSDGSPYVTGELMRNQKLANILEQIARGGPQVFYSGTIAHDILLDLRDIGAANITADDLLSQRAFFTEPLKAYLPSIGYDLYTTPPSSSGVLTAFTLKLMDGYNYSAFKLKDTDDLILFYHRLTEAWKIAFKESENLGDIGFNSSVEEWTSLMVDNQYVEKWRSLIKDDQVLDTSSLSTFRRGMGSTSGVCVMTVDGSGVSTTTTVGGLWGCKKRGKRTGIIFNDGMSLFSLRRLTNVSANYIGPLKHGRSSTSPLLVVDDNTQQIKMMHSAAGSQRIVTSISFIASQILWRGIKPNEATDEPRIHHQGSPNILVYDDEINQAIIDGLRKKGHQIQALSKTTYPYLGVAQTVQVREFPNSPKKVELTAVSDYRKGPESAPSGF